MKKRLGFLSLFGITALLLAAVGAITALAAPSGVVGSAAWDREWTNLAQTLKTTITDNDEDTAVSQVAEATDFFAAAYATGRGADGSTFFFKLREGPIQDWVNLTTDNLGDHIGDKDGTASEAEKDAFEAALPGFLAATDADTDAGLDKLNELLAGAGADRDDGVIDGSDIIVQITGRVVAVFSVDAGNGVVTFRIGDAADVNTAFTVTYFGSVSETVDVKVTSLSDPTGFTLRLPETSRSSGIFERSMQMDATATTIVPGALTDTTAAATSVKIKAADGDVIKVEYTDVSESSAKRTATVKVELTDPTLSSLSPASKTHTKTKEVTLSVDVTDALSGVKSDTIQFYVCEQSADCTHAANFNLVADSDDVGDDDLATGFGFNTNKYVLTDVAGGKRATVKVELEDGDGNYEWYAKANDNAGNEGQSQGDADLDPLEGAANSSRIVFDSTALILGTDPQSAATSAITGQWWDATKTDALVDDVATTTIDETLTDERIITDASKAKNTSIRVVFDGALDGTSIQAADFKVNGAIPANAEFFSSLYNSSVFLTVAALNPSETPKVEVVVGGVADKAGNVNTDLLEVTTARDGIGPTLTVTLSGDTGVTGVALSGSSITATMTTNETLLGVPSISVVKVVDVGGVLVAQTGGGAFEDGLQDAGAVTFVGTDTWSRVLSTDNLLPAGGASKFVAQITGSDSAGNTGLTGGSDPVSTSAILFELDKTLAAPVLTPADDTDVFRNDPFITIDFTAEGTEYAGDTHKTVTLTALTLDGTDILAQASTTDNAKYIVAASGLALGDHVVIVSGADEAGNKQTDFKVTFTVKEVSKVSVPLKPGQNLVSLPNEPADPAINSVITLTQVTSVITYDPINPDPATGSPWLTASRVGTGPLTGSLTSMDARHGYWVKSSSFDPISVEIPDPGFAALPPSIQVVGGWNLVPVVTIGGLAPGAIINADTYFGSTAWVTAYTFDPETNTWNKILPNSFQNVVVGTGYWLYVTADGILVP